MQDHMIVIVRGGAACTFTFDDEASLAVRPRYYSNVSTVRSNFARTHVNFPLGHGNVFTRNIATVIQRSTITRPTVARSCFCSF